VGCGAGGRAASADQLAGGDGGQDRGASRRWGQRSGADRVTLHHITWPAPGRFTELPSGRPDCALHGVRRGLGKVGVHGSGAEAVEFGPVGVGCCSACSAGHASQREARPVSGSGS